MDALLSTATIGTVGPHYAGQDFESPLPGDLLFSFSEQSGDAFLAFCGLIPVTPAVPNAGEEDFEIYEAGPISVIDKSLSLGAVSLGIGYIYPTFG